jgi:predicted amidohydrolase
MTFFHATCVQVVTNVVNGASTREEAMAIVDRTIDRWEQLAMTAVRGRAGAPHVLVFPEFALTGFPLHETAAEWIEKAALQIPGSPQIEKLQKIAQKLKVYIGANTYESDPEWPGRYFNCSFLINPSGELILKYRRINTVQAPSPHDFMDRYFDRYGVEGVFPVAKTELGNLAMIPCGEIMYPEAIRVLMFRGAEVILHPTSDIGTGDKVAWECAKRVRASENMIYLVSSNAGGVTGGPPSAWNMGHSKIIDFNGHIMVSSEGPGESVHASVQIDVGTLRRARQAPGSLNRISRQRTEMYMPVYNNAHFYPPNSFPDKPMGSKLEIMEIMRTTMDRLYAEGVITPP